MTGLYQEIRDDLFGIAKRLKEIDKDYFVVFSYKKKRFEVHNRAQRGGSFCLAVPFDRLDCRAVEFVRKTSSKRADKIIAETECSNDRLFKEELYKSRREAEINLEKAFRKI